jgi:uncharacterized protein (DUF1697 family)
MAAKATGRHVALLRGINVGRAKRVAMADLRTLVEGLGYGEVRTLLNSGNLVFTVPGKSRGDAALRIEEAIATQLGLSSRVVVLSATDLATVVTENPLLEVATDHSRLLVTVLNKAVDRSRLETLLQQEWAPDVLAIGSIAAYLWCSEGILTSRLATTISRVLGDAATSRNWTTITKLKALAEEIA